MPQLAAGSEVVVLVVEDEPIIRETVAAALEDAGFSVLEAPNGDEAMCVLESRSDVRLIFSDIDMPGSINGAQLARIVHGRWPPIEIVLTSGYGDRDRGDTLQPRGVFIAKPYSCENVVATLRQLAG